VKLQVFIFKRKHNNLYPDKRSRTTQTQKQLDKPEARLQLILNYSAEVVNEF